MIKNEKNDFFSKNAFGMEKIPNFAARFIG